MKKIWILIALFACIACTRQQTKNDFGALPTKHHLSYNRMPEQWDEAIPLGNGLTGALVWQKEGKLRISIDRADLWDLRLTEGFDSKEFSYQFVQDQVLVKKDIVPVQQLIDQGSKKAAPSKIPAGAIEIDIAPLGEIARVDLDITTAVCTIDWKNGAKAHIFVPANENGGRIRFENLPDTLAVQLLPPAYQTPTRLSIGTQQNYTLADLGYPAGTITQTNLSTLLYHQPGYGDFSYEIALRKQQSAKDKQEITYSITSNGTWYSETEGALTTLDNTLKTSFEKSLQAHAEWWKKYWSQSSIELPDTLLEKQWYLEMYKFGATSRKQAPPISLQAVWTADNGGLPPWHGDYHNDLNTQLSYWPGYVANHLEESSVFTDWLWQIRDNSRRFTRRFFGVEGMNVACIATLTGEPLGGWSPYSVSPTAAGWLAHHFYLQWKYSMDGDFLADRAYPWVKEVAIYFDHIAQKGEDGKRKLPLSSSPEINDNRLDAWFAETTNYDLANIRLTYTVAAEMADALGLKDESAKWKALLAEWPGFASDEAGLCIAPHYPLGESHRHLSHMLAIHPFGLIDVSQGKESEELIRRSVKHFEALGTKQWVGYSFSWMANMKARLFDGEGAARYLRIFVNAFCSPNSFHLNGDQLKKGYSNFTYRPFTLEGNFACASALQEMLLQSHTGVIRVFPAIPTVWKDISFHHLRAMGAFLVSAQCRNGKIAYMTIYSEKGGLLRFLNPFTGKIEERETSVGETVNVR